MSHHINILIDRNYQVEADGTITPTRGGFTATTPDGDVIDLIKIQAVLNVAFGKLGYFYYAEAANEMSKLTGVVQGPHEEWLLREEAK